jgi:16S rRNA (cytidine1402-2'-O)-methyltransferase
VFIIDGAELLSIEAANCLLKTLEEIKGAMGDREIAVCRELTKKFEEVLRGGVTDLLERLKNSRIRGEIVLVISGQEPQRERDS